MPCLAPGGRACRLPRLRAMRCPARLHLQRVAAGTADTTRCVRVQYRPPPTSAPDDRAVAPSGAPRELQRAGSRLLPSGPVRSTSAVRVQQRPAVGPASHVRDHLLGVLGRCRRERQRGAAARGSCEDTAAPSGCTPAGTPCCWDSANTDVAPSGSTRGAAAGDLPEAPRRGLDRRRPMSARCPRQHCGGGGQGRCGRVLCQRVADRTGWPPGHSLIRMSRARGRSVVGALGAVLLGASIVAGPAAPAQAAVSITWDRVATGLAQPTQVTSARDGSGRVFVVEKQGTVRVFRNGRLLSTHVPRHPRPGARRGRGRAAQHRLPPALPVTPVPLGRLHDRQRRPAGGAVPRHHRRARAGSRRRPVARSSPCRTRRSSPTTSAASWSSGRDRAPVPLDRRRRRQRRPVRPRPETWARCRARSCASWSSVPAKECGRAYCVPRRNPYAGAVAGPRRDLGQRRAQHLAVLGRPGDRRPLARRRRPGLVRGDRPDPGRAGGWNLGWSCKEAFATYDASRCRVRCDLPRPGRRLRARLRELDHRRLRLPRRPLRRPARRALRRRRLRLRPGLPPRRRPASSPPGGCPASPASARTATTSSGPSRTTAGSTGWERRHDDGHRHDRPTPAGPLRPDQPSSGSSR